MGSAGMNGFHDTALAKGPGVVVGRSGASFGQVHLCLVDYWPHNTALYVTDFHGNDVRFTYYFLKSIDFTRYNSGSAQASLNRNYIYPILVRVPEPTEQHAIAAVLGALDDKIELNRRMNETLEAMARTLFQHWFVDATQAGLPKGWEERGLDEIAHFLNGLALQKFPPHGDERLPVIKIAQLRAGHTKGADRAGTNLPPQYIIEDGDVLFSWSGSLEVEIWCGGRGALNQHLFKVTSAHFPKWFYYLWTRYHLADFQNTAANKATTMGHIQRHHLSEAKAFVPPPALMETMNKQFAPLLDKIIANRLESRTLAALRDALLPKLMSGELRVAAAEYKLEAGA
jgi:type I restriction enzyme S subunit